MSGVALGLPGELTRQLASEQVVCGVDRLDGDDFDLGCVDHSRPPVPTGMRRLLEGREQSVRRRGAVDEEGGGIDSDLGRW